MTHVAKPWAPASYLCVAALALALPLALVASGGAQAQDLASFGVLAGSAITNTGPTVINGNLGVSPGTAITGFPPGVVAAPYSIQQTNAVAAQAQSNLATAYNVLASRPATADLTGMDLGGKTLIAGVYNFNTSAQLTGTLTLNGQNNPNAVFIFNIGSTLTTASASTVVLINGASANNVFFRVGSSATLGTTTTFAGRILALTSITLNTGANINCGAALARNGAVTLDTNTITICPVNAVTVGGVLDDVVTAGGILPIGFQVLALLTPEELALALAQIAGEAGSAFGPTASEAMDSFLSVMLNHADGPGVMRYRGADEAPGQGTVSVMGYAAESSLATDETFASFNRQVMSTPANWEMWAAVYGGYGRTSGDATLATHERTSLHYGLAGGIDYDVSDTTKAGFAFGVGGTSFNLSDGLGGGRSSMFDAGFYASKQLDAAYVTAGLAYGFHDVTTDRYVTIAGIDHLRGNFGAHTIAGQIEAGYEIGMFTPYAAVRGQVLNTPSYAETTVSGQSTFALNYAANTALTGRTEIGTKFDWSTPIGEEATLGLHARVAWLHAYGSDASINAAFQSIPDATFTVEGATAAADSLLLSLVSEISIGDGFNLAASVDSELSTTRQTYGGSVRLGGSW